MDNLMKLVTTALEWSYLAGETDVRAERLKSAAELLVLRHDTLKLIYKKTCASRFSCCNPSCSP
jgi:hypothetical protein